MSQARSAADQLMISIDGESPIAWFVFVADNADALDAEDFAAIWADLVENGSCTLGGGAAGVVEITVAEGAARPHITAEDRATIRSMIVTSGYLPSAASYELSTRGPGRDRVALQVVADEIAAQVKGTSLSIVNGYRVGQQAYAMLLDLLAEQERVGRLAIEHDAFDMEPQDFAVVREALLADGLACGAEGEPLRLTDAGRAAYAGGRSILADIAGILGAAPLPSLGSAFATRRALFGAHAA